MRARQMVRIHIALTDISGVYGAPRLYPEPQRKHGVQAHIGAEVTAQDGSRYTLHPRNRARGIRVSAVLITRMKLRGEAKKKKGSAAPGNSRNFPKG